LNKKEKLGKILHDIFDRTGGEETCSGIFTGGVAVWVIHPYAARHLNKIKY